MNSVPAGWYPDPWGHAAQRWWDGQQWTSHVDNGPAAGPRPAPGAPPLATPGAEPPGPAQPQGPWTVGPTGPVGPGGLPSAPPAYLGSFPGTGAFPPVAPPANPLIKLLALGGAVLVAVGSFLTWASVDSAFIDVSKNGMEGDGVITFPGALIFGGLAASSLFTTWSKGRMIGALGVAVLVVLIAIVDIVDISSRFSDLDSEDLGIDVSVGIGLWLVLAGAAAGVAGCVLALAAPKGAGRTS